MNTQVLYAEKNTLKRMRENGILGQKQLEMAAEADIDAVDCVFGQELACSLKWWLGLQVAKIQGTGPDTGE